MLWWTNLCVGYALSEKGSPHIAYDTIVKIAWDSFSAWTQVTCSDGNNPTIQVHDMSPVVCDQVEYNQHSGNANIVVFRTGTWPHSKGASTIALTTVTFNSETGEIYDADMEINDGPDLAAGKITAGDDNIGYDLQSVITHEAGHFYGLAHSSVVGATMQPNYDVGSVKMRSLEQDDISGICDMYGTTRPYNACDPTPRHGFQATCGDVAPDTSKKTCCTSATAPGHSSSGVPYTLALVALGIAAVRLRKFSKA
jgi:hypothetical protein